MAATNHDQVQPQVQPQVQQPQPQYVDPNQQQFVGQNQQYVNQTPYAGNTVQPNIPHVQYNQTSGHTGAQRMQHLRNKYSRHVPTDNGAAVAYKLVEFFRDIAEKTNNADIRISILRPDISASGLSGVLVHKQITGANGKKFVAVHTLIIEPTNPMPPRNSQYANLQLAIPSVAGDTYNNNTWQQVLRLVATELGESVQVIDAQCGVIYNHLSVEQNERELGHVFSCAVDAVNGMTNLYDVKPDILTGDEIRPDHGMRLTASTEYGPAAQFTAAGLPVRADISITVSTVTNTDPLEQDAATFPIVTTDLYVDLVHVPPMNPYAAFGFQMPQTTVSYLPRVVITNIQNQHMFASLEVIMLGLANALGIMSNSSWVNVFTPRERKSTIDFRDIGAVGYEVPQLIEGGVPGHIVIDGDRVKASQLVQDTISIPSLMFSMDIPEVGDTSWITNALIGAANNSQNSIDAVINACNNITNGQFAQFYDGSGIVDNDNTRIHLAMYNDSGVMRDTRNIDHLALLNIFGRSGRLELVQEYDQTFINDPSSVDLRLDQRYKILNSALGEGSVILKGYARRVTFRRTFLEALNKAFYAAGIAVQHTNGIHGSTVRKMTAQDYVQYSMGTQAGAWVPTMFTQGGGPGNYHHVMGARTGTWGNY